MSIRSEIIKVFQKESTPFLHIADIYDSLPLFQKSSIRSALSRGTDNDIFERVDRGVYFYDYVQYKLFRHAKRIFDTHSVKPKRRFDVDLELTCEGYAPIDMTIDEIESVVNPRLLSRSLEVLNMNGILLTDHIINFYVIGSEWLDDIISIYDWYWKVEVKLVNNSGSHYLFEGEFYVQESEWN